MVNNCNAKYKCKRKETKRNERRWREPLLGSWALVCVSERVSQLGKCNCLLITYHGFFSDCNDDH